MRTTLLLLVGLAGCASSSAPRATEADATRARLRWPGITLAELDAGRSLYVGRCGTCHVPPPPGDHTPEAWPGHVHEMAERAGLDDAEALQIERYVVTMAAAATAP